MRFHVITLFPEVCRVYTDTSILGRAQKTDKGKGAKVRGKKLAVSYYNPRDYTTDKHNRVDDRPYGGGPGMVLQPLPILKAVAKAVGRKNPKKVKILLMSPRGTLFNQTYAKELALNYTDIVLMAGRYEGIDSRVKDILQAEAVSVGDYVLTGGELPALTIIDAVARNIPGVLGTLESLEEERTAAGEMYTRPELLVYKRKQYRVPEVLVGGNHAAIEAWRAKQQKLSKATGKIIEK